MATAGQGTEATKRLGAFGSPTFVVGRELFWGDDRLKDAIAWRARIRARDDGKRDHGPRNFLNIHSRKFLAGSGNYPARSRVVYPSERRNT